jgi:hypothetical protein
LQRNRPWRLLFEDPAFNSHLGIASALACLHTLR